MRAGRGGVEGVVTGGATAVRPAISAAVRICEPAGCDDDLNGGAPASEPGAAQRGLADVAGAADSADVATAGAGGPAAAGADPVGGCCDTG